MAGKQDLPEQMRARADFEGLPPGHELRTKAAALDQAILGFFSEHQTVTVQQFVGAWARARKAWCAHTGEALL